MSLVGKTTNRGSRHKQPQQDYVSLVAEDDIADRLARTGFHQLFKCEIACAENGPVAVERLKAAHIDVVLMDINMPIMAGLTKSEPLKAPPTRIARRLSS